MCGIVGVYNSRLEIDRERLESACKLISHRGPDASNMHVEPGIGLGHQRLSIIDLTTAANQPMSDPTGQVILIYNGELYNYRELRQELKTLGHEFRTQSDTEVLLHAYLEYGSNCVPRLEGMFAFVVWDRRCQLLFLARDRLGIKPLYYRISPGQDAIYFASEIKALLVLDPEPNRVDRQALHDYLTFRYTVSPRTMFEGIKKLPPAHTLVFSKNGARLESYWKPDYRKVETLNDAEWIAALRHRLTDAVNSHLVGDVPVGVLLSGGLDSSIVAAVMQRGLAKPIKTFSVAFVEGGVYDERPFARQVAKHIGADHHEIAITSRDFVDTLPAFVWHMDEPVGDPASIPLYFVSQLASRHVKVVLSGEGSDELLAGYAFWSQFEGFERFKLFKKIPEVVRGMLLKGLNDNLLKSGRVENYLRMSQHPISAYGRLSPFFQDNVFSEDEKKRLYRAELLGGLHLKDSVDLVRAAYLAAEEYGFLDQMLFVSMTQWLPEDLLIKADKMTMAHSLELRVPFLDHSLVEFAARMPANLKVRKNGNGYSVKYALKKAFADILPREIIEREKLGFAVPYARWFRCEMRELLHDVLLSQTSRESGILNPSEIQRLLNAPVSSEENRDIWDPQAKKVWSLLVFELWRQRFRVACS